MTFRKFLFYGFILVIVLAILKWLLFGVFGPENGVFRWIFYFLVAIFSVALVRRAGVLNYLEAVFIPFLWWLGMFLVDLIFISAITGERLVSSGIIWISYVVMFVCIFFMHKKRHVEIRKTHGINPIKAEIFNTLRKVLPHNHEHGNK